MQFPTLTSRSMLTLSENFPFSTMSDGHGLKLPLGQIHSFFYYLARGAVIFTIVDSDAREK